MILDLGDRAKDVITGFTGVATAKTVWLNGCVRYCLEGQDKDGQPKDYWADEQRCELVQARAFRTPAVGLAAAREIGRARAGGPQADPTGSVADPRV